MIKSERTYRPDRSGRLAILKGHDRKIRLAAELDLDPVAAMTVGFAGADLATLVNEAALVTTRRNADAVTLTDFTRAIERVVAGIEKKSSILGPRERQLAATHELGHALVALALPGSDKVHKVSIIPHGAGALGYTLQRPSEDRHMLRHGELQDIRTGSRYCSADGRPRSLSSATLLQARPTIWSRQRTWRATWSCALGWTG